MHSRAWVWIGLAALAAGCPKPPGKCDGVGCPPGQSCDPADGTCKGGADAGADAGSVCGTCSAPTPICDGPSKSCVTCNATDGCNALAPVCDNSVPGGRCVQCVQSSDCPSLTPICNGNSCFAADAGPAANSSCASPEALVFNGNVATTTGDTTLGTNSGQPSDASPTCSTSARSFGRSLVYSFTLSATHDVSIDVTPSGSSGLIPVVYARAPGACANGAASAELFCLDANANAPSTEVTYTVPHLAAGTYYVWVSGASATFGAFELKVSLAPPTATPPNESCANAIALQFDDGGYAIQQGDTFAAGNASAPTDQTPSCDPSAIDAGRDVVYSYTLSSAQDVYLTLTADPSGSDSPTMEIRAPNACASGALTDELSCGTAGRADSTSASFTNQGPGTYYVWVDSDRYTSGPFTLEAQLYPPTVVPPNNNCAGAIALSFVDGGASIVGNNTLANHVGGPNDQSPTCSAGAQDAGEDMVYTYALSAPQDVLITATPDPNTPFPAVVFVRQPNKCSSGLATDELGCGVSAPGTFQPASLYLFNQPASASPYFLWVSSDDPVNVGGGRFTLSVSLLPPTPPATNADCAQAADAGNPLVLGAPVRLTGSTANSINSYEDVCGTSGQSGPDLVYGFSTTTTGQLTAAVTPKGGYFQLQPYLYLRTAASCPSPGSLGCVVAPGPSAPATLVVSSLPPGSYDLIVDGQNASSGPFTLDLRLDPVAAAPTNDSCSAAAALDLGSGNVSVQGDTRQAKNATTLSCSAASTSKDPEVVYQVTAPSAPGPYNLRALASTLNSDEWLPVVSIRSACASLDAGAELACSDGSGQPPPYDALTMALGLDAGESTWLWLGSSGGTSAPAGPFSLEVELAPTPAPNDRCAGAIGLTLNTSQPGTTLGATDDYENDGTTTFWYSGPADAGSPTCATSTNWPGADVVYKFTAATSAPVTVTLTPERGYAPSFALLSQCKPASCIDDDEGTGPGVPLSLTLPRAVPGATYYVVIDSPGSDVTSRGSFQITASQ